MFSTVPLRSERIYRHVSIFSQRFTFILDNQLSLNVNLVCFDFISAKDNLVQESGAVWKGFSARASDVCKLNL